MNITSIQQVAFCNSPVIVRLDLQNTFPSFLPPEIDVTGYLKLTTFDIGYISGPPLDPTSYGELNINVHNLKKARISSDDKYISFEIQDYLKNDLVRRNNLPNVDMPVLLYQTTALPYTQGGCLFYRLEYYVSSPDSVSELVTEEAVATLGYRWRNEQTPFYGTYVGNADGFNVAIPPKKRYNDNIAYYAKQEFDFTRGPFVNSNNFIKTTQVTPINPECAKEPLLIIFLNRQGLFEYITTFGKVSIDTTTKRTVGRKSFRDMAMVNVDSTHFENVAIEEVYQTYTVNTGIIDESMNTLIEELIYSEKVYLVRFYGNKYTVENVGITVDSTLITVDNTTITTDSDTITLDDVGYFSTFTQVPVSIEDTDFVKRTVNNDRRDISYTIKFKESAPKIKN